MVQNKKFRFTMMGSMVGTTRSKAVVELYIVLQEVVS